MSKRLILIVSFLALMMMVLPAAADIITITQGDTVFIGEQGLNLVAGGALVGAGPTYQIAWYAAGATPGTDAASKTLDISGSEANFYVSPADFTGYTGAWYEVPVAGGALPAFYVQTASLDMKIWNAVTGKDASDKSAVRGDVLTFRIDSNLYPVTNTRAAAPNEVDIDIKIKDSSGSVYSSTFSDVVTPVLPFVIYPAGYPTIPTTMSLLNVPVAASQYFLTTPSVFSVGIDNPPVNPVALPPGTNCLGPSCYDADDGVIGEDVLGTYAMIGAWDTGYQQVAGTYFYKAGTYEVWVESNINKMKDNLGSVTGTTVSKHYTVTIKDEEVTITANTDSVVRGNDFSVTVEGRADQPMGRYIVWVKGTSAMTGLAGDVPPIIKDGQSGITRGAGGAYLFDGVVSVQNDVAPVNPTFFYAQISTDGAGKRTVGFSTDQNTKDKTYTIRVQDTTNPGGNFKYDEVKVKVSKGAVTIDAEGTKSYYVGEEVKLFGENTDSENIYLFLTGPNLPSAGGKLDDPIATGAVSDAPATFVVETVKSDDTWEYKWATGDKPLDAGTYTVYAVSQAKNKDDLADTKYDTLAIQLKKPFVTASLPSSVVAKGDDLKITGTAEGDPTQGIQIWILGTNKAEVDTEAVEDDKTFEKKITGTGTWSAGQYFVVVQHPMYNDALDVVYNPATGIVRNIIKGTDEFKLSGADRLMGSDAAQALVSILDQPNIDDTYAKLFFLLEESWINIDAISDKYVGDKFTISGTTNNAVDDTFLVTVTSASFKPTEKTQAGEFSGISGSVSVVKGTGVDNLWSFEVDATGFKPDQYIVKVECIETGATATTTFFVSEVPATTVTTAPPVTTPPTTVPPTTVPPTTVPPTTTPGFGAVIALIGLGAVAVLVLRRH